MKLDVYFSLRETRISKRRRRSDPARHAGLNVPGTHRCQTGSAMSCPSKSTGVGATLQIRASSGGVVFQNTGRLALSWDESDVFAVSGPHAFVEDFDGAIAAACAALGA